MRIVHLGIGNFARAHQAWYTMAVDAEREWGIAAFTGRRPDIAQALAPQQGLYTLIERDRARDRLEVIDVISSVHAGSEVDAFVEAVAAPDTTLVTLTVTEAGYRPGADPPRRLAEALVARHQRRSGSLAVVSCDNLQANGRLLRERVLAEAAQLDSGGAGWIASEVSFVSTSVDRITPRVSDEDRALVTGELGLRDEAPVVCEPFSDWVLCGEFPAGRPAWERAGARFVDEIEPWEARKLWLLNGGHCLLAYLGLERGHETVAVAGSDPELAAALERYWDLAARLLPGGERLELDVYRAALRERFANARIGYPLEQIAADGLEKLRNRVAPVIVAARAAGVEAGPALAVVEAWVRWLIYDPARAGSDQNGEALRAPLASGGADARRGLLELLEII